MELFVVLLVIVRCYGVSGIAIGLFLNGMIKCSYEVTV